MLVKMVSNFELGDINHFSNLVSRKHIFFPSDLASEDDYLILI